VSKLKKTLHTLTIVLFITLALVSIEKASAEQTTVLHVAPPTYTATDVGETFSINVSIANASNLQSIEFEFGYNTTLLDATNITEGPFMKSFGRTAMYSNIHDDLGYVEVQILLNPVDGSANGSGTTATITFKATHYGNVSCPLDLYNSTLGDRNGIPIAHQLQDGHYKFAILWITITTPKHEYTPNEIVSIYGTLTQDVFPRDALVALEVEIPAGATRVIRTLQTGPNPPKSNITILEMYPCDAYGNPKSSFQKQTSAHVCVIFRNSGPETTYVHQFFNVYDANGVPFDGTPNAPIELLPGANATFISAFPIPSWAATGNATAYASLLTGYPRLGGVPHTTENSTTFEITDGGLPSNPTILEWTGPIGTYNLTYKLPPDSGIGNYTVHATSIYHNHTTYNNHTFQIPEVRDIAIISVTRNPGYGYNPDEAYTPWYAPPPGKQGIPYIITVVVKNNGSRTETFTLKVYYKNATYTGTVGTKTVTDLYPNTQTTVNVTWSLSGLPPSTRLGTVQYTIFANTSPLPEETNLENNELTDGTLKIKWPGNTNGDGQVSIADVGPLVIAWKSKPGDAKWNDRCDYNRDGEIDTWDVSVIIFEWGAMP